MEFNQTGFERAQEVLRALNNPQRLQIVCLLAEEELHVGALTDALDISQSALSQHLKLLKEAGVLTSRQEGLFVFYAIGGDDVKQIISTLHGLYCGKKS